MDSLYYQAPSDEMFDEVKEKWINSSGITSVDFIIKESSQQIKKILEEVRMWAEDNYYTHFGMDKDVEMQFIKVKDLQNYLDEAINNIK